MGKELKITEIRLEGEIDNVFDFFQEAKRLLVEAATKGLPYNANKTKLSTVVCRRRGKPFLVDFIIREAGK